MKKSIKIIALVFSVLLVITGVVGCSKKANFYSELRKAKDIEQFEYAAEIKISGGEAEVLADEANIKISGVYVDNKNMSMEVMFTNGSDTYTKLTNVYFIEDKIYVDVRSALDAIKATFGFSALEFDSSLILKEGEDYYELSPSDLMGEESTNTDEYSALVKEIANICLDFLEEASLNVSPSTLTEDNGAYSFEISNKNIQSFVNELGKVLDKEYENTINSIISKYEGKGEKEKAIADTLKELKKTNNEDIINAIKEMKEYKYEEAGEFTSKASVSVKGAEGSRILQLDVVTRTKAEETGEGTMDLSLTVTEKPVAKLSAPDGILTEESITNLSALFSGLFPEMM